MKTRHRTAADEKRVDQALARLAVAWRVPFDAQDQAVYQEVLEEFEVPEIERACREFAARVQTDRAVMPAAPVIADAIRVWRQRKRERLAVKALPAARPMTNDEIRAAIDRVREKLGPNVEKVGKAFPGGRR